MEVNLESVVDKMLGSLYGQAIGDALGLGTEFMRKKSIPLYYPTGLQSYNQLFKDDHRERWHPGQWTDDTDMMLCILRAFEKGSFNLAVVASNFKDWYNGYPLGIGRHTVNVLGVRDYVERPVEVSELVWKVSRGESAANGGLMRTSVVGLPQNVSDNEIADICRLTHFDNRCVGSCVIVSRIINELVWNDRQLTLDEILSIGRRYDSRIEEWVRLAYKGSLDELQLDDRDTMGYTLRTLAAALWAYFHSPDFKTGLLAIVNEGGDADTNAAVACSILGAKFGWSSIPEYYVDYLYDKSKYKNLVRDFTKEVINSSSFASEI